MASVVGFDIGNDTSCVALVRKRGIDVLMNKESKRETPAVVNFGEKMRFLGTDGAAKLGLSPQNTVHQVKRILGKKFRDPRVQADIAKLPFKVVEAPDGGCLVNVMYCNELVSFTPEQIMAIVLVDVKRIAEAELGGTVTDCTIAVPTFYTEMERYAMLNASQIAGLNCLRLINENTATALSYGIYKPDLPDNEPVHVVFVDVGHSSTQVSVVALKKSGLLVKSHAWDRDLGGRDFDEVLFNHFAAEFYEKHKLDVKANKKASFKLRSACEKAKKMLSANSEAPISVECLMEEVDLRGMMNRETFEKMCEPLLQRFLPVFQKALDQSQVPLSDISSIEIVGSSTRIPSIFRLVEGFFKKTPSRTLNAKECVSRGCALQCAMLAPTFKVRDFEVIDSVPYTVECQWEKDGQLVSQRIFERGSPFPSTKMVTLTRSEPFKVSVCYADEDGAPSPLERLIGEVVVGPIPVPPGAEKAKLKVKVTMNLHGLVNIQGIQSVEEEVVEEEAAPADVKMEDAAAAGAPPAADGVPMEAEAPSPPAPQPAAPKEKKTRVKKTNVPYNVAMSLGYSQKQVDDYMEAEGKMQAADKLQEETNEKKNALEAYVYDLRNKLYDIYGPYVTEEERSALSNTLQSFEDWLYDEGEDCTKSVYISKLAELKKFGEPVEIRYFEDQNRASAVNSLQGTAEVYLGVARSDAPQYSHLTPAERETVIRECQTALNWLAQKITDQGSLNKNQNPILFANDISKKRDVLERVCKPIVSKPPPPPPKKEAAPAPAPTPAPEPPQPDNAGPMESEGAGARPEEPQQQPMES